MMAVLQNILLTDKQLETPGNVARTITANFSHDVSAELQLKTRYCFKFDHLFLLCASRKLPTSEFSPISEYALS
jgi:hypothetical protein